MTYIGTFKLSITEAMREQLITALQSLTPVPISNSNISKVQPVGGIYQLLVDGESVYIGKSANNLQRRLEKHYGKLIGRRGYLIERSSFRCVYIDEDLDALAPEKMLISVFKESGQAPWNNNGFGNNDPGRRRDESLVKANHFDRSFPIDLDFPVTLFPSPSGSSSFYFLMNQLKSSLPYTFRFAGPRASEHRELEAIDTCFREARTETTADWLSLFAQFMPENWLIVALPGYIICYKENDPSRYGSRMESWLSIADCNFRHESHIPAYEGAEEIMEEGVDERD